MRSEAPTYPRGQVTDLTQKSTSEDIPCHSVTYMTYMTCSERSAILDNTQQQSISQSVSAQAQLSNASRLQEKAKWHHPQMWLKKAWFVGASVILSVEFKNPKTSKNIYVTCEYLWNNCELWNIWSIEAIWKSKSRQGKWNLTLILPLKMKKDTSGRRGVSTSMVIFRMFPSRPVDESQEISISSNQFSVAQLLAFTNHGICLRTETVQLWMIEYKNHQKPLVMAPLLFTHKGMQGRSQLHESHRECVTSWVMTIEQYQTIKCTCAHTFNVLKLSKTF